MKAKALILSALLCLVGWSNAFSQTWVGEEPAAGNWYLYHPNWGFLHADASSSYPINSLSEATRFTITGTGTTATKLGYEVGSTTYYLNNNNGEMRINTTGSNLYVRIGDAVNGYYITTYSASSLNTSGSGNNRYLNVWVGGAGWSRGNGGNKTQWRFISDNQLSEVNSRPAECPSIAEATFANRIDLTAWAIQNPNMLWNSPWNSTTPNETGSWFSKKTTNKQYKGQGDGFSTQFYENWNENALSGKIYTTTLQALPAGSYCLTAEVMANNEIAGNKNVALYASANGLEGGEEFIQRGDAHSHDMYFYLPTAQVVEYGLNAKNATSNHLGIGKVSLQYMGTENVVTYYDKLGEFRGLYNELKALAEGTSLTSALATEITTTLNDGKVGETSYATVASTDDAYDKEALQTGISKMAQMLENDVAVQATFANVKEYLGKFFEGDVLTGYMTTLNEKKTVLEIENFIQDLYATVKANYKAGDDITFLVADNSFELTGSNSRWTSTDHDGAKIHGGEVNRDGEHIWSSTASISQTITGLKAGVYSVTARVAGNVKITLNNDAIENWTLNNENMSSLELDTARVVLSSDGDLTIAISSNAAFKADYVTLQYLGAASTTTPANFESLVQTAQEKRNALGFDKDQYAPYANIVALETLKEAERVYNVYKEHPGVVPPYTDAESASIVTGLQNWTQNTADLDAVYNGNFAQGQGSPAVDIEKYGWSRNNAWGQFVTYDNEDNESKTAYYNQPGAMVYGTAGNYTMPLKKDVVYVLTFQYASQANGSNNGITASIDNENANVFEKSFEANPTIYTATGAFKPVSVKFTAPTTGNYVLTLANQGNTVITGVSITKVASSEVTVAVSDAKWATFIAPFDVDLTGTTIEAYTCYGVTENVLNLAPVSNNVIPANTPVILHSAAQASKNVEGCNIANENEYTVGLLTGTHEDVTVGAGHYMLAKQNDKVAFYKTDANRINKAGKAYLDMPEGTEARAFYFSEDDETTAIESIQAIMNSNEPIYDLNGRKLDRLQKGINIIGGHKVLVK